MSKVVTPTHTLDSLGRLAPAERADAILQADWTGINGASVKAQEQGLRHPACHGKRIAWAAGIRIQGSKQSGSSEQYYQGRLGNDCELAALLERVKLTELAWNACCEQEPDGHPESGKPAEAAKQAFEDLIRRDGQYVLSFARARSRGKADPEELSANAWHEFFLTYCRPGAPRRFLALSAIRSTLCTIVARQLLSRDKPVVSLDQTDEEGERIEAVIATDRGPGPGNRLERSELRNLVLEAIALLPPRQGLVTALHLVQGYSQSEVAQRLGCSRAYVSQTLDTTLTKVRDHLRARGWGPPRNPENGG